MIEIEKPKVDIVELSEDYRYGKFVGEPLERGYGITIGNALRRILLSSLPGVAVNSIKIDGVLHEFSTIPGVKEDVTEIILSLKELSATIDGEGSRTLKIEAKTFISLPDEGNALTKSKMQLTVVSPITQLYTILLLSKSLPQIASKESVIA